MPTSRNALILLGALACLLFVVSCGEREPTLGPEEIWNKFARALSQNNALAIQALATRDLTRRVVRAGPTDFAGLIHTHVSMPVCEIRIVAQDETTTRLEVSYKAAEDAAYSEDFVVLMEKPGRNWRVAAIQGQVAIMLPGF